MSFKQGLFWNNSPVKPYTNLNFHIKDLIKTTFLRNLDNCYFVFTGTNQISFDRLITKKKVNKKWRKKKKDFFLFEPLSYYFKDHEHNLGFYSEFDHNLNNKISLRADELDSLQGIAKKIGPIDVNLCDFNIPQHFHTIYPDLNLFCRDIFLRQAAKSHMNIDFDASKIEKPFWCGNGRYTIHRHLIMCKLAMYHGNYSWFYNCSFDFDIDFNWVDKTIIQNVEKGNKILNQNEYKLDFEATPISVTNKSCFYSASDNFNTKNLDYKKTFDKCFVAVINETRFAQPSANISEKTIDAIVYGKPFLLVAPPYSIQYLHKLGLKTFSDYWNEDYDKEENHSKRLDLIYREIDKIAKFSIKEMQEMYTSMSEILEHNRKLVKNLPLDRTKIYDKH